jgi:DNA repair exonuclease SbcCD nuclease subunit
MKIEKPKIAIFSDLHLGEHNNSATWHKIAIDWCDWFISKLKERKIKDVIFMGDWHHNRSEISVHTLDVSALLIDKFKDFNLHIIIGNHDIPYKHGTEVNSVSVYANRPTVSVYTKIDYIRAFDRKLCVAPWDSDLSVLEDCDVLFGHLEIQTFKMGRAKACDKGWSATDLLKKCPNIFTGHFHLREERKYKEGNITYVGNPFQMNFGDRGDKKGFYILDLDSLEFEFLENVVSPEHHIIKLSDVVSKGTDGFKLEIVGNVVRLNVDIECETKELHKIFDKISAYKPVEFTPDYTYVAQIGDSDAEIPDDIASIDIKTTMSEYIDGIDIYGKEKCKEYLIELYEKSRV